jgi:hypothetical protein
LSDDWKVKYDPDVVIEKKKKQTKCMVQL